MTFSEWLRGAQPPASQAARTMGIYAGRVPSQSTEPPAQLPPDDQPGDIEIVLGQCGLCTAPAVVALMRVDVYPHLLWAGYEAATVSVRQACRHHADEALSVPDSPWHEAVSARLP